MIKLSVITVTKNNINDLLHTIISLKQFSLTNHKLCLEFIIINGGDPLNVEEVFAQPNEWLIDLKIIEGADRSLYHAMNKGVRASTGDFLWFMNSGDIISNKITADTLYECITLNSPAKKVFVFETINHENIKSNSNWKLFRFVHQGIIYCRSLHDSYGEYVDIKSFTSADYLFFSSIISEEPSLFVNFNMVVSKIGKPGLSARFNHNIGVAFSNWFISKDKSLIILFLSIMVNLVKYKISKFYLIRQFKYRLISTYIKLTNR